MTPSSDDPLAALVSSFAEALLAKLQAAREKHHFSEDWQKPDWKDSCQRDLLAHLEKGDPRDVAGYCAFMWHHGWQTRSEIRATSIAEAMEGPAGVWRTCSGCYESEDGHPVGTYRFSKMFGCTLGAGCSECGGIGAVWDTTDYGQMAESMLADEDKDCCISCGVAFVEGDAFYPDHISGCDIHAACAGSNPESFTDSDGNALKPGDPIPAPQVWSAP